MPALKSVIVRAVLFIILGMEFLMLSGCSFSLPVGEGSSSESTVMVEGADGGETVWQTEGEEAAEETEENGDIFVHVCGCVRNPGLYRLPSGARAQEAVDAAGGFTKKADREAWNLAEVLSDGIQVCIPSRKEEAETAEGAGQTAESPSASQEENKVNINTASMEELTQLPGIGDSRAAAIIACREELGAFTSIEEIKNAEGIGDGIFDRVKDLITVD